MTSNVLKLSPTVTFHRYFCWAACGWRGWRTPEAASSMPKAMRSGALSLQGLPKWASPSFGAMGLRPTAPPCSMCIPFAFSSLFRTAVRWCPPRFISPRRPRHGHEVRDLHPRCAGGLGLPSGTDCAPDAWPAPAPLLTPVREQPARAVQPQMALEPSLLLSTELLGAEVPGPVVGLGAVVGLAALGWSLRTSFAGGAAIILLLLGGDPEERVASGANENEVSTCAHRLCTPRHCALHSFAHLRTPVRTCLCVPADPQEHCDGDHALGVEEELPGRGRG